MGDVGGLVKLFCVKINSSHFMPKQADAMHTQKTLDLSLAHVHIFTHSSYKRIVLLCAM